MCPENRTFSLSPCARKAKREAASFSGESHAGSNASIRANNVAIPSGVVGHPSSRMPTVGGRASMAKSGDAIVVLQRNWYHVTRFSKYLLNAP